MKFEDRRQFQNQIEMELKRRHEFWTISTGDLAFLLLIFFILIVTIARIWKVAGVEVREKNPVLIFKDKIIFDRDSADLTPDEIKKIDKIIEELRVLPPGFKAIIRGVNSKKEGYNRSISLLRARAVEDYMLKRGIWQGRLEISSSPDLSDEEPYVQLSIERR